MADPNKDKMKTYLLKHGRPVTDVVYNRDGDLLFSCDKDGNTFVWRSDNGERLGSYNGPVRKAVLSLDVDRNSKRLLTGCGDGYVRLWEVETGRRLYEWNNDVVVRCVKFAHNDKKFLSITDNVIGQKSIIQVTELPDEHGEYVDKHKKGLLAQIVEEHSHVKVYKGIWTLDNQNIITCTSEGRINVYNTETQKKNKIY
jgi:translation initiation factor 3 subunit I